MKTRNALCGLTSGLLLLAAGSLPTQAVTPIRSFELNGNLSDAIGGLALISEGGTIGATSYQFGPNQGLILNNPGLTNPGQYSIEMKVSVDAVIGTFGRPWIKLIDFGNLTSDNGLYSYAGGSLTSATLNFYPFGGTTTAFVPGKQIHVVITRNASTKRVISYAKGIGQFSFIDYADYGVFSGPSNVIRFFHDDNHTGNRETGSGVVDFIRVYNTVLTAAEVDDLNELASNTPPVIAVCPPDRVGETALPYDFFTYPVSGVAVPADATAFNGEFWAGSVSDDVTEPGNLMMGVSDAVVEGSSCPVVIHRTYVFTDEAGNVSDPCVQTIHVNNLFAPDAIVWHQPLARKGMSEDTEPSLGGPKKFKMGQTIPIKVHALGCEGDITSNSNVTATVKVLGDTTAMMEGEDVMVIDNEAIGGSVAGEMVKIDGHLKYNLDTKSLHEIPDTKVYLLQVTVTDSSTGESVTEEIQLEAK